MAHFAELNDSNTVLRVIVVNNNELLDENGVESEEKGIQFCKDHFGQDTKWIQTSYNANFRKHFAGLGYVYDKEKDAFIPPKTFLGWVFNEETYNWEPPIPKPNDPDNFYIWDFDEEDWKIIPQPVNINTDNG